MEEAIIAYLKSLAPIISMLSLALSIWIIWDGRRRYLEIKVVSSAVSAGNRDTFSVWIINKKSISYIHSIIIYGIGQENTNTEIHIFDLCRLMQRGEVIEKKIRYQDLRSFEAVQVKVIWHEGREIFSDHYLIGKNR